MKQETIKRILSSIILIPIALFFMIKGSFYFAFFLITIFLIALQEWFKMSKKKMYSYLGIIFLFFYFYFAFLLRGDNDSDLVRFFFVIIICVATDIGGFPDIVQDGVHGYLVPPEDPVALSRALEDVLADSERSHEMSQAMGRLADSLSGDMIGGKTVALYKSL